MKKKTGKKKTGKKKTGKTRKLKTGSSTCFFMFFSLSKECHAEFFTTLRLMFITYLL
jgi:hypothetical protein